MSRRKYSRDYRESRSSHKEIRTFEQIARTAMELQKLIGSDFFDMNYSKVSSKSRNSHSDSSEGKYYSLCISQLPYRLSDHEVRSIIYREFENFDADFNVKFSTYNGQRVAYINFRSSRDASDARSFLRNFHIEDKLVHIEPIIPKTRVQRRSYERSRSPVYHQSYKNSYDDYHHKDSDNYRSDRSYVPSNRRSPRPKMDSYDSRERERSDSRGYSHHSSYRSRHYNGNGSNLSSRNRETDLQPTRTLFVGNLPLDITESEIRRMFAKFGPITDIDIKKPTSNNNFAFAFVKFENLEVASEAKDELNGTQLRNYRIKIGFGKVNPTNCVWVGGLGPWILYDSFEKEMSRFGLVKKIHWPHNKDYAYVLYDSIDVAINAVEHLRGAYLGDEKKAIIKVDFADSSFINSNNESKSKMIISSNQQSSSLNIDDDDDDEEVLSAESAKTIPQLIDCLTDIWTGMIVLKNNNFGCRLHMLKGDRLLIKDFLCFYSRQQDGPTTTKVEKLTITQRMKLDNQKLAEMKQRIETAGENGYCLLLASSYVIDNKLITDANQPQRPLKNLSTYLRTKESAGVIFLKPSSSSSSDKSSNQISGNGVLHAFPPCDFSFNMLLQKSPKLIKDYQRDDFLVVLLLRNCN